MFLSGKGGLRGPAGILPLGGRRFQRCDRARSFSPRLGGSGGGAAPPPSRGVPMRLRVPGLPFVFDLNRWMLAGSAVFAVGVAGYLAVELGAAGPESAAGGLV